MNPMGCAKKMSISLVIGLLVSPFLTLAQTSSSVSSGSDRWLHVRVINQDSDGETVRVNVPLEMAEKVLPTINKDRLHDGKIKIESFDTHGVDIRTLFEAVRSSKDGEFVTIQNPDSDVRVAKQNGYFLVYVTDKPAKKSKTEKSSSDEAQNNHAKADGTRVEVKVPMKVVEALLSGDKDELNVVAALHALSAQGDTELVSVKDNKNIVRVWLDSKNISD